MYTIDISAAFHNYHDTQSLVIHTHQITLPLYPHLTYTRLWLERCRDGSYAANALHGNVWVVCACIAVCIVTCFIVFCGSVFGESASLHDLFLHFLAN